MKQWKVKDDLHKRIVFLFMPWLNVGMKIVGISVLLCS